MKWLGPELAARYESSHWPVLLSICPDIDRMQRMLHPGSDVQRQIPDAVRVGDRFSGGLPGGHSIEHVFHRRAMPGISRKHALQLI